KFLLGGRFIFGPDVRSVILTLFLIIAPVGIFCDRVATHIPHELSHGGRSVMFVAIVFTVIDLVLLFLTSGRDPGIIPRNTHPPEPETDYYATPPAEFCNEQTPQLQIPRTKDVVINGVAVKVKYCHSCMLYRPPRCSHCSVCNNCVERFDHHCPWVGQCIGQRNYRFFLMFIFSSTLLCAYIFVFCLVDIIEYKHAHNIVAAMSGRIASVVLTLYTFIVFWFIGGLAAFHVYLICTNQTTYENFRSRYERKANPYNQGFLSNIGEVFFTKIPPSRSNFRKKVQQDSVRHGVSDLIVCRNISSPNTGKGDIDLEKGGTPTLSAVCTVASEGLPIHDTNAGGVGLGGKDYGDTLAHAFDGALVSNIKQMIFATVPPPGDNFHEKVQWDSASNGVLDPNGHRNVTNQNTGKGDTNLERDITSILPAVCTDASEDLGGPDSSDDGLVLESRYGHGYTVDDSLGDNLSVDKVAERSGDNK
ncbi:hypothetical protein KI387_039101, partial [Taxus chinensis]